MVNSVDGPAHGPNREQVSKRVGFGEFSEGERDSAALRSFSPGGAHSDILTFRMISNVTIQVRQRGTLTLPAELREKYRLADGDPLSVVDLDGAILLTPKVLIVPRIAAEMERLRKAKKLSLKDLGGPTRED
jgi:AbrB family looped-hinge helix DNA binding protein